MAHPTISIVVKAKLHHKLKAATNLSELVVVVVVAEAAGGRGGGGGQLKEHTSVADLGV